MCLALQVRWWAVCCNWGTQSSRQAHVAGQEDRQPATKNRARGACGGTIVGRHREVDGCSGGECGPLTLRVTAQGLTAAR